VLQEGNGGSAESYGAELATTLQPTDGTTLRGSYSYIQIFGTDATSAAAPRNQLYLQSSTQLSREIEGDVIWRYVDRIPGIAPAYNVLDLRLAWKPYDNLEWSFVARNLLDDKHPEYTYSPIGDVFSQVPTEVYTMITLTY
jgi:outer membrane receptor protein involved in Fe transport